MCCAEWCVLVAENGVITQDEFVKCYEECYKDRVEYIDFERIVMGKVPHNC